MSIKDAIPSSAMVPAAFRALRAASAGLMWWLLLWCWAMGGWLIAKYTKAPRGSCCQHSTGLSFISGLSIRRSFLLTSPAATPWSNPSYPFSTRKLYCASRTRTVPCVF